MHMKMMKHAVFGVMAWAACAAQAAPVSALKQFSEDLADMVEEVMPSVVVIRTEAVQYLRGYDWYYGRRVTIPRRSAGQGSGVIFDDQGHVLTSRHVVAGAQQIEVILTDETVFQADIVGADPNTDLAVLKIRDTGGRALKPLPAGDSDRLRIGEIVVAVGSPFSLSSSVTMGIVSQKGRSVGVLPFEDFIQTDAPINPGNSGGPLVNLDGRLVGINAVIQTTGAAPGNIGIGFAVPVNLVRRVADAIIRTGRFERPWLGIRTAERPADGGGVLIEGVFPNTPAAEAGLRAGDIILRADGLILNSLPDLLRAVYAAPEGRAITFTLRRESDTLERAFAPRPMTEAEEE
jgi:serine protease Do